VIQVSNLSKSYGRQVVFDSVGFTVNAGERIGLVGRNGRGKTTLLRMITGEEETAMRLPGTIAANVLALEKGARIFRVHDVTENMQALKVASAITSIEGDRTD